MPFYLKDEFPILSGEVTEPRKGNWHAEFEVQAPDPVIGELTSFRLYDVKWEGRITKGGVYAGRRWVYIEGGKGDLRGILPAKDYQQQPVRIPAQDILTKFNMKLSTQYADSVLNERLTTWVRVQGPASSQFSQLISHYGDYYWRVLSDSTVGIFSNEKNYSKKEFELFTDYQIMHYDPTWLRTTIAIGGKEKMVTHFKTFLDVDADYIVHKVDSNKLRTLVWQRNP